MVIGDEENWVAHYRMRKGDNPISIDMHADCSSFIRAYEFLESFQSQFGMLAGFSAAYLINAAGTRTITDAVFKQLWRNDCGPYEAKDYIVEVKR